MVCFCYHWVKFVRNRHPTLTIEVSNLAKKQRVPNAQRRKHSIRVALDAALHLFVTQGYEATTMDDIGKKAGVTKGTLYFYFRDKLSLLDALLERTETELFEPIYAQISTSKSCAKERIIMLCNWLARIGAEQPELPLLHVRVSLEMHQRDNIVEARVAKIYSRLHKQIAEIIRDGQKEQAFSSKVSAKEQATVVTSLIDGLLLEWHRWGKQLDGRALAANAQRFILNGLMREAE